MLKELLEQKKCFKLICGAGNQNLREVERLVALYAAAGCRFFDLSADEEVLKAAQRGFHFGNLKWEMVNRSEDAKMHRCIDIEKTENLTVQPFNLSTIQPSYFCISIGTKNDVHFKKARIDSNRCTNCAECIKVCPQGAIRRCVDDNMRGCVEVIEKNCIGCKKCLDNCEHGAIKLTQIEITTPLHLYTSTPLSCIELHASDSDESEVDEIWDYLCQNFDGMLSLCIGREKLSKEKFLARIKRLVEKRKPYTTIIQADGFAMTGGEDDFETTREAVKSGALVQGLNLPIFLLLSGGTNSKTAELAKLEGVDINGVGVGSYARKIVREYIERDDFFENNEIFDKAVSKAKKLIERL